MTREELLKKIETLELSRLNNLSRSALQQEISAWFNDEILESESREDMIADYMTDFMRWQNDKVIQELEEYIKL